MRLVDHVYDDQVIDQLTVKLILPEGARYVMFVCLRNRSAIPILMFSKFHTKSAIFIRNVHLETPYPIERSSDQLHYTYLDTFGRPVLVATKKNLVEQHIQDMVVRIWSINERTHFTKRLPLT